MLLQSYVLSFLGPLGMAKPSTPSLTNPLAHWPEAKSPRRSGRPPDRLTTYSFRSDLRTGRSFYPKHR